MDSKTVINIISAMGFFRNKRNKTTKCCVFVAKKPHGIKKLW